MAPYRTVYPLDEKKIEDCVIRIEEEETQGDEKQEKPFFAYHISERPSPAHSPRSFSQVLVFALCCSNIMTLALAYFLYSGAYCPVVTLRDPFSLVPVSSASTPAAVGPLRDSGALASIRFEQRIFTSPAVNSSFSSSSSSSHSTPSSAATSPSYFGNPRSVPGIDRAWKELLAGQFFALSADESAPLLRSGLASPPRTRSDPVYAELDVYHSLSCLNSVRMQLDAEYYAAHGAQDGIGWRKWDDGRARVDACLDRLRQTIMCSADLTVLPLHSSRNAHSSNNNNNNNNPQTPHQLSKTCRRWDDVKSWVDRRHERTRFLEVRRQGGL